MIWFSLMASSPRVVYFENVDAFLLWLIFNCCKKMQWVKNRQQFYTWMYKTYEGDTTYMTSYRLHKLNSCVSGSLHAQWVWKSIEGKTLNMYGGHFLLPGKYHHGEETDKPWYENNQIIVCWVETIAKKDESFFKTEILFYLFQLLRIIRAHILQAD